MNLTARLKRLEQTYRSALRWYPKTWRRRNEDAVVGTLLDVADEDHRTVPAKGELANLRANALGVRLGPFGRIPAPVRNRVAALALGLGAGIGIVALAATAIQRASFTPFPLPGYLTSGATIGFDFAFYGIWILAAITGIAGPTRVARVLVLASIVVSIGSTVVYLAFRFGFTATTTTVIFLAVLALLSLSGNPFGSRRGRVWILVSTLGSALFFSFTLIYQHLTQIGTPAGTDWFLRPAPQWIGYALPFVIVLALILWRATKTPWAPAILIAEIPIILFAFLGWQDLGTILNALAYGAAFAATLVGCWLLLRGFGVRIRITRA